MSRTFLSSLLGPRTASVLLIAANAAYAAPIDVDLPAQPLAESIRQLSAASGVSIRGDGVLLAGKTAPAVKGHLEPQAALDQLLQGSGLLARQQDAVSIELVQAGGTALREVPVVASPPVNPDGSTPESGGLYVAAPSLGPFGPEAARDTPFSVNSIPQEVILDQQDRTLTEAMRNDPSYGSYLPASVSGYSNFFIRGFPTDLPTNNRIDGLPVTSQSGILLQSFERIDLYKGLSAMLFGFTYPGGLVNYVSKRPLAAPLTEVSASYENDALLTGAVDVSRRFGADDQFGVRVNAVDQGGNTAVDDTSNPAYLASVAADWRVGDHGTAWINLLDSRNKYAGLQPPVVPNGHGVPSAPHADTFLGVPFSAHIGKTKGADAGYEGDLAPWLRASITVGEFQVKRDVHGSAALLTDSAGDFTQIVTPHNLWELTDRSANLILTAHYSSGDLSSRTDFGLTANTEQVDEQNIQPSLRLSGASNLYDPRSYANPNQAITPGAINTSSQLYRSYLLRETVDLGAHWTFIGALNASKIDYQDNSSPLDAYDQSKIAPTLGAVFKPWPGMSLYASYTEGLEPGTQAGASFAGVPVANPLSTLGPFVAKQYEVGAKYRVLEGLETTLALFQISMPSAIYVPTNAAATEYTYTNGGEQRNRGVELNVTGKLTTALALIGGVALIDPVITESQDGSLNGKLAIGMPRVQASIFGEYAIASWPGFTALAGAYYTGNRYLDSGNTATVPGFVTVDAGFKYSFDAWKKPSTLRLYVQNLAGKDYWVANANGPVISLGDPRTIRLDLKVDF